MGSACGVGAAAGPSHRTSSAEHAAVGPDRDPRRARRDRLGDCGVSRRPRRRRERGRATDRERHRRDGSRGPALAGRARSRAAVEELRGPEPADVRGPPRARCACSRRTSPVRTRPTAGRSRSPGLAVAPGRVRRRPRRGAQGSRNGGRCDGTYWGGAGPWVHEGTPPKPGGAQVLLLRRRRRGHRLDARAARPGEPPRHPRRSRARADTDHAALFNWWRFWHHRIGKVAS